MNRLNSPQTLTTCIARGRFAIHFRGLSPDTDLALRMGMAHGTIGIPDDDHRDLRHTGNFSSPRLP